MLDQRVKPQMPSEPMKIQLKQRPLLLSGGIFLLAFFVRAFLWFHKGPHDVFDQVEVVQTAMCFAKHGFLGNPFIKPTGPTAHVTPAFPFLIGMMYRYAPNLETGETLKNILTMLIASLQFALLPLWARAARIGLTSGVVAGIIGALVPMLYLDCSGDFEAPLVATTLALVAICSLWLQRRYHASVRGSLLAGVLWGWTAMVSAQLLFCGALYEALVRAAAHKSIADRIRQMVLLAVGLLIGVLPWTIRNYVELGSPVFSRDNAGLELYVSNNDYTGVTFDQNLEHKVLYRLHPHSNPQQAELVRELGEVRYNKLKLGEAKAWIASHPARFMNLTIRRFADFWFLSEANIVLRLYWEGILVLGVAGLVLARRSQPQARLLLFAVLLIGYPLPHYIVQASERYRYPLNVVLLLFTGYALIWTARRMRRPVVTQPEATPMVRSAAAGGA